MPTTIQPNDRVFQPEHPEHGYGIVRLIEESVLSDERICQVAFEWVPGLLAVAETALKAVPKLESGHVILSDEWGGVEELQRRLGAALVMAENSQSAAFIRSFTMPLPHQAFLLEKILAHRRFGHVIADDVGMGKTIEAGLIIATLRQRDPQCRVLVLCPAGVVLQWQDEMDEHFGLPVIRRKCVPSRSESAVAGAAEPPPAQWRSSALLPSAPRILPSRPTFFSSVVSSKAAPAPSPKSTQVVRSDQSTTLESFSAPTTRARR